MTMSLHGHDMGEALTSPHRPSLVGMLQHAVLLAAAVSPNGIPPTPVRIVWSSVLADENGRIDYGRCKALVAILLALCAGVILCALMLGWAPFGPARMEIVTLATGAMLAPLTSAYVLALRKRQNADLERVNAREVQAIRAGQAPGRRASDGDRDAGEHLAKDGES